MKAPIPSRHSFWWNDTDGSDEHRSLGQTQRWWSDDMLDRRAAQLLEHHAKRVKYAPWFMESETNESEEAGEDAPWLSEAEIKELAGRPKFKLRNPISPSDGVDDLLIVPFPLLYSFSRRVKETHLYMKMTGGMNFMDPMGYDTVEVSEWRDYLSVFWYKGRPRNKGEGRRVEDSLSYRLICPELGSNTKVFEATRLFFDWMLKGKVALEVGGEVDKAYLLEFARALGAPLFRAAILEQCQDLEDSADPESSGH